MPGIRRTLSCIVLAGAMLFSGLGMCSAQMLKSGHTRSENIHARFDLGATGLLWKTDISVPGAAYLRIFFTGVRSEKGGDYYIRFANSIGQILLETTREEFEKFGSFVTREIPGSFVEVQVIGKTPSSQTSVSFDISETGFDALQPALLSTPPSGSDLQSIKSFASGHPIREAAEAVARLSLARLHADGLHRLYNCTGFMVSRDILVTNYHCIRTPEDCIAAVAYFTRPNERGELDEKLGGRCEELIEAIYGLDIAIVRIRWQASSHGINNDVKPLSVANRDIGAGERLSVIGHPNGNALEVSKLNCRVGEPDAPGMWRLNNTDFGHTCTTAEGSSGSPLVDEHNKVVGLHHLGFDSSGRWATENRAVKASSFSRLIETVIEKSKSK